MSTSSFGLKKASPSTLHSNNASPNHQQKSIIEIYTDWANHYLDKLHNGRKKVKDLQSELQDGLILAEVIEAVMSSKVPDIHKKPKTHVQMTENIQKSLDFLLKKGVSVSDIHAKDIREGNLKAILGLFFQLSRFKQQQKMIAQERSGTPKIPSVPPSPAKSAIKSSSNIPSPLKKSFLPGPKVTNSPLREVKKGLGKRTSSSSGFSSARSLGSESSVSLSSDTNFPSPSALRRINEQESSPKLNHRKIPTRLASPKRSSPKLQRSGTEIKDYGLIDQHYPPHRSKIPSTNAASRPSQNGLTKCAPSPSGIPSKQGCTVRPVNTSQQEAAVPKASAAAAPTSLTSENDESTAQMTASFQTRTKSLPRTKRREDGSPGPANVAVVSPMPTTSKNEDIVKAAEEANNNEATQASILANNDDPFLKGLVPLGPLGLFKNGSKATHQLPFSSKIDQFSTVANAASLFPFQQGASLGVDGYMSDSGDAFQLKSSPGAPLASSSANSPPSQSSIDDGYLSEGGASFYAKKIQSRIAFEKQRTVEEQNRKLDEVCAEKAKRPLPGLPDVLGAEKMMSSNQIYRVVGGRKHVQKSEAGMQTEAGDMKQSVQEHYDWKQAMAYNAKILSSQEKAMDDYLRRQRASVDHQMIYHHQQFDGGSRHRAMGTKEDGRGIVRLQDMSNAPIKMPLTGMGPRHVPSSTPATPTGRRRNNNGGSDSSRNGSPSRQYPSIGAENGIYRGQPASGGSLERKQMKIKISGGTQTYVSDSEYGHYMSASPGSNRKNYNNGSPSNSKSLPKGSSSLNYGLMMEKIQQKRQQRQYSPKINDGSLSDSNYCTYEGARSSSPYSWLQPASTYATNVGLQPPSNEVLRPMVMTEDLNNDILGSNESLNSVSSSIQQARANSLTKARLLLHQQQINRSNSGGSKPSSGPRSNISEKSYSSLSTNRTGQDTEYYGIPFRNRTSETYSSIAEERTDTEIMKLRKELAEEHEKVLNLTSQLATNAHVVAAFEQSLANMTARLQQLTNTSEKKDHELNELRRKIELFKQCGVDAGLIQADNPSDSESEMSSAPSKSNKKGTPKRSGWLRNSFSKAFNKNSSGKKGSISDAEESPKHKPNPNGRASSALSGHIEAMVPVSPIKSSKSSDTIDGNANSQSAELVNELKRQLVEKENMLTETRLEALSSAHQLESLRDTVTKMRTELMSVRCENEKLQSMMHRKSLNSSQNSLNNNKTDEQSSDQVRRHSSTLSESSILSGPSSLDLSATTDPTNREGGKLVPVVVLNTDKSFTRIGTISVSGRSSWDLLDSLVHRLFKEYVMRVDPTSNLGLNAESIGYYQVGEIKRTSVSRKPELLPYGYLVGDATDIVISLKRSDSQSEAPQIDALAFETLTPKTIIQRYLSLLLESKRIILSGPTGAGKTFLAIKIANFVISRSKKSIANFCVQRNNVPELKDFLKRMAAQDETEDAKNVIILDSLQHAGRLEDIFQECSLPKKSFIIGTLNLSGQGAQTPTSLQLQHNFRVIQLTPHAEPLRGLVGRCLRQRLLGIEAKTRMLDGEMSAAVDWVAKIHLHLNKILEGHASGEATLSPALFMNCPIGHDESPEGQGEQVRRWFLHLWDDLLHPKISEAIKEGIQMYGHRAAWEDPTKYLQDTWPWANSAPLDLEPIRPEDVGYDGKKLVEVQCKIPRPSSTGTSLSSGSGNTTDSDPLFNMLLHLQEAASNETALK